MENVIFCAVSSEEFSSYFAARCHDILKRLLKYCSRSEKNLHHQIALYHFLHNNSLSCGKSITMKRVLHIYYFKNIDYIEKVSA